MPGSTEIFSRSLITKYLQYSILMLEPQTVITSIQTCPPGRDMQLARSFSLIFMRMECWICSCRHSSLAHEILFSLFSQAFVILYIDVDLWYQEPASCERSVSNHTQQMLSNNGLQDTFPQEIISGIIPNQLRKNRYCH